MERRPPSNSCSWDDRYAAGAPRPPDPWLVGCAPALGPWLPGPVLELACGLGQNALWLAGRGLEVQGIDASEVAVTRAAAAAVLLGRSARFRRLDLNGPADVPALPPRGWGAIVVLNFLDRALLPAIGRAVAPGGVVAYKTHLAHSVRGPTTRPRRPSFLLRPGELLRAFGDFTTLDYAEQAEPGSSFAALLARRYSR